MTASELLGVVDPLVGVWLLGVGVVGWRYRPASRVGPLTVLAGVCWFAGTLFAPLLFVHRGPLVHLHLSYPTGRLRGQAALAVTAGVYVASLVEGRVAAPVVALANAVAVAAVATRTFVRASGPSRRAGRPALAAALGLASVIAVGGLNGLLGWGADAVVAVAYDGVVAVAVTVLLVDLLAGRWVDATVTDLVLDLGGRAGVTGLRQQLRRALGDPTLDVGYWVPARAGYVDDTGQALDLDRLNPGRVVTLVCDDGAPLAVLVHDPAALADPSMLRSVATAARLAVANARLQGEVEARSLELAATSRRIVAAGDRERRALVDALESGAERRLATLDQMVARLADQQSASARPLLDDVRSELRLATAEVRELARGIRPPALTSGGLAVAVPELAARTAPHGAVRVMVGRLDPVVESAVYFVCAEGLANVAKHAVASRVDVDIEQQGDQVVVRVVDDGVGGADGSGSGLRGLADRVEALGGTFVVRSGDPSGTHLVARVPVHTEGDE